MKLSLSTKTKKDLFVAIFHTLKNCTGIVSVIFRTNNIYIQGMDKTHVCLFDVHICDTWFDEYVNDQEFTIHFDTNIFYNIIGHNQDTSQLVIEYLDSDADYMHIDILFDKQNNSQFDKHFRIPLVDVDSDLLGLPDVEYDAEFVIPAKTICDLVSQMAFFGDNINFKCTEDAVHILTHGVSGEMLVKIPINELTEYSIVEDEEIDLSYSINYVNKMCLTNKVSTDIAFSLNADAPMKIKYDLGDNSHLIFFIAPKIV
jgi:proliferating cell nuclear antigen